jgi:hypothetical protein
MKNARKKKIIQITLISLIVTLKMILHLIVKKNFLIEAMQEVKKAL